MWRLLHRRVNKIPRAVREHAVTGLLAAIGLSLSLFAFELTKEQIGAQRKIEFNWVAHNRNRLLKQGFENALEPVRVVRDYVQSSAGFGQADFHRFASVLLARNHGIEAIALIDWRSDGKERFAEPVNLNLASLPANKLRLSFVASRGHTHFTPGYDVAASAVQRAALQKAANSGGMAVSARIELFDAGAEKYGVMACLPFYRSDGIASKPPVLQGFVLAVARLDELAHAAVSYLEPRGVDLVIEDESADEQNRFLEFYASRLSPRDGFSEAQVQQWLRQASTKLSEVVRMADRQWSITAVPNAYFRSAEAFEKGPWVMLSSGVLLTLLLSIYLVRMKLNMAERLSMSQVLKDREALFWQMTETVDDVFWALPADKQRFLYVSPAFESMWGVDCQALYEQPGLFAEGIHPADRSAWSEGLEQARDGTGPVEYFYRLQRADGAQRWIRDNAFPVRDENGRVYRLVGVAEDITEKKQAEDALRDSEHKLRTLFNQSPDTIMTVDGEGNVLFMNHGAALDFSADLLPPAYRQDYRRLLGQALRKREVNSLQYQTADEAWWEIRIVPIVQDAGARAAMVIATDITEKRNLQAQAIRNARLASIGVLSTGVAHEINNPNNAIQTGAALLARVWGDVLPVLREYYQEQGDFSLGGLSFAEQGASIGGLIAEIKDNSRRIETIVKDLKHLGRKDPGDLGEDVDINSAIEAAANVLGRSIKKYTDHWRMALAPDLPPVKGNLQQLEQVFINIMLNALQSLPDKAHGVCVESAADAPNQAIIVRVIDQGDGISDADLSRVSEPFFTTRLQTGGVGLGLSISTTIVENHHGSISVESSKGVGTLVSLRLPTHQRAAEK